MHYDFNPVTQIRLFIDETCCDFTLSDPLRIVHRKTFDYALLKAYQDIGGEFMKGSFSQVEEHDGYLTVTLRSGEQVSCRYLVGADGSNSQVRRYLKPDTERGYLVFEQYIDQNGDNTIDIHLSQSYGEGYYYRFPSVGFDIVGYGDRDTTQEKFKQVIRQMHIPEGKVRGAYVYLSNDYPLHDQIILIGDAGGFANRCTSEGLYDAFMTAEHATMAIRENRPFREVNAEVFKKMKKETRVMKLFLSRFGLATLKWLCHHPALVQWMVDTKMQRETFWKK